MSDSATRYPWGDRPLGREDILDREQVGELLGLRPSTVDDLRRRGDLPRSGSGATAASSAPTSSSSSSPTAREARFGP